MASWLNDVTYADVRALDVAVEKLKIQLSTNFLPQEGFQLVFCRKIKKIENFLSMLSTFQCVVGLDTMIKQVKTLHCGRHLSTSISTALYHSKCARRSKRSMQEPQI